MTQHSDISDEAINAFIDGELDVQERRHLLRLSEKDDGLRQRVCEARNLKDQVMDAYAQVPDPPRRSSTGSSTTLTPVSRGLAAVAALVCLCVGLISGLWLQNHPAQAAIAADPVFLELDEIFDLSEAKHARASSPSNIMLHVGTNDLYRLERALTEIEVLLAEQQASGNLVNVEIVANGYGLDLMRVAKTPLEQRIRQLAHDEHLSLIACQRAVQQLEKNGIHVDLIPEAGYAPAALDRIIQRLREGWVYVKV
jgi:uncharacterized protein